MDDPAGSHEGLDAGLARLYQQRFPPLVRRRRKEIWEAICQGWMNRFIKPTDSVLEIAPGYCEFLNVISAREKVGIDLNPEARCHADPGVEIIHGRADNLASLLASRRFDAAFASNFFEHCRTRDEVLAILRSVYAILKPGGRFLVMGPNFKYCPRQYYDFFDHHLALTEASMQEAMELAGFEVMLNRSRFLPFTMKSAMPSHPLLVKAYLRCPWLWTILGRQFFLVGVRSQDPPEGEPPPRWGAETNQHEPRG